MGPPWVGANRGIRLDSTLQRWAVDAPKDHGTEKTRVRQGGKEEEEQGTSLPTESAGIMVVIGWCKVYKFTVCCKNGGAIVEAKTLEDDEPDGRPVGREHRAGSGNLHLASCPLRMCELRAIEEHLTWRENWDERYI